MVNVFLQVKLRKFNVGNGQLRKLSPYIHCQVRDGNQSVFQRHTWVVPWTLWVVSYVRVFYWPSLEQNFYSILVFLFFRISSGNSCVAIACDMLCCYWNLLESGVSSMYGLFCLGLVNLTEIVSIILTLLGYTSVEAASKKCVTRFKIWYF